MKSTNHALIHAIRQKNIEGVKESLKTGINPNKSITERPRAKDKTYEVAFPLFEAVEAGNSDIVALLLEHGADANLEESYHSVLQAAIKADHMEIVQLLVKFGARVDTGRETALDTAKSNPKIYHFLKQVYDLNTHLLRAVYSGDVKETKALLEKGAKPNVLQGGALRIAKQRGQHEMVDLLLENGVEVKFIRDILPAWARAPFLVPAFFYFIITGMVQHVGRILFVMFLLDKDAP